MSNVCYVPLRNKVFQTIHAPKAVEQVGDYNSPVREPNQLGNEVAIRLDRIYDLASDRT
jgi:hypothetical protein